MGNSSGKRMAAFYHNQQTDYENWLRKNTVGQYRQVYRYTRSQRAKAAMIMALANGSSLLF